MLCASTPFWTTTIAQLHPELSPSEAAVLTEVITAAARSDDELAAPLVSVYRTGCCIVSVVVNAVDAQTATGTARPKVAAILAAAAPAGVTVELAATTAEQLSGPSAGS